MKFEDFLMQPRDDQQRRQELEEEVVKLQGELDEQQRLNRVLQCALHGPVVCRSCLCSLLPVEVQVLLAELAMVEEEIVWLEGKVQELKLCLYQEKEQNREREAQQQQWRRSQQKQLMCKPEYGSELRSLRQLHGSQNSEEFRKYKLIRERKASLGRASETQSMSSTRSNEETPDKWRHTGRSRDWSQTDKESVPESPNEISEELVKCLTSMFLKMNQASLETEGSATVPRLTLPCMTSKAFISKASFNSKVPTFSYEVTASNLDPYGILQDLDGSLREVGPYKNFVQITRSSLDTSRISECFQEIGKLRVLMHELCTLDLTFLTYKQKLAFWINIYNASIMHAFLQHGLPSTQEKLLGLLNKAVLNVGGIVLNALAIEHFILRHPCESKHGPMDEKEILLRHAYGLGYPEPNVTFALCRGSWSSPALRIYTPDDVVNELGRAKLEYLEASVGFTNKKKVMVPKLLQWHMRDFADDMESLLEWIYSQLPCSGSLKRLMMECLNGETKSPTTKMVEIQPYESEFRYLLPL